jgi:hypothetical protein
MIADLEAVLHDAASLYRFVDSVCSLCNISGEYPSYLESSQHFFRYLQVLGDRTQAFLEQFIKSLSSENQVAFNAERQKLATLRFTWFELHRYVRPAVNAHTLNIPSPLLLSLLRRFRSIGGLTSKDFVILHTDNVNYFEAHAGVRDLTNDLRLIIPDAPSFPERFGVIEFPYSQAESVFLNSLIAHEMGHFLFQELSDAAYEQLLVAIGAGIKSAFGSEYSKLSDDEIRWCRDVLLNWSEEIFCDFFALWMIGPCFSLAYIELLDLNVGLYPSAAPSSVYIMSSVFSSHPARLFRLKEHVELLKSLGWWEEVTRYKSHYVALLEKAVSTPISDYVFYSETQPKQHLLNKTLEAFVNIPRTVQQIVRDRMAGVDLGLGDFQTNHDSIEEYLKNGVVPSTVVVEKSAITPGAEAGSEARYPGLVAILNASYKFYLESLPALIDRISESESTSCFDRNVWTKRLESWTMKAIEDSELLAGAARV